LKASETRISSDFFQVALGRFTSDLPRQLCRVEIMRHGEFRSREVNPTLQSSLGGLLDFLQGGDSEKDFLYC
jgi:hypothetical protein